MIGQQRAESAWKEALLFARLLKILHGSPIASTGVLFALGMLLIFGNMLYLSDRINKKLTLKYVETYVQSLEKVHSMYSSEVVARLRDLGIKPINDYRNHEGAIPFPATFSIELAEAMTNPELGITNRLYSDYPFAYRTDGGPRDEFESLALATLRFAEDKTQPFIRFETVNGRKSMRYGKALVMEQSCVDCHNSHPQSTKHDWKVGDVRGVREVIFPVGATHQAAWSEWGVTVAVMLVITIVGLGILFLVINALRASIALLSNTNAAYGRFVPHEFLGYLKKQTIVDVQLSDSVQKQMTVLFSDIRNFTQLSEHMTPEENFAFVNSYFGAMGPVVRKNKGFIDKYFGDGMMALFDDANDAVRAAIEMQATLDQYNRDPSRSGPGTDALRIGIGVHKGLLRLGTIGERNRMDGTVISDAVNLSARIESLTKYYGIEILITDSIMRGIENPGKLPIRLIDKVKVKGRQEPTTIHEIFSGDPEPIKSLKIKLKTEFEQAIALYQVSEFEKAIVLFRRYLDQLPGDRPAQLYLERCERFLSVGVPADWDGTFVIDVK
ncbi:MAG: adenylate/guanylate cyclase domain-containing protein [Candidatus Delongbacteria bacterium]|nr:adenylate/guanylate cyclase domain-containing protein [Candidatus Delongbacteria bacterium]